MVKKNLLTPVLAGVLGVSIVGSGVGYYFTNQADKESDEKTKNKTTSEKISAVADNINNTVETAQKAINGELDFAYDANVSVDFGTGFTSLAGQNLSSIKLSTSTKQKGQNTSADMSVAYGDKTLASVNACYARENGQVYLQVPELSQAYLKVGTDDVKSMLEEELAGSGVSLNALTSSISDANFDFDLSSFDWEKYEDAILNACPEAVDGEKISGDIDGHDYKYDTKIYTVTETDAINVTKAVLNTAKTDETIKKIYDQSVEKVSEVYKDMPEYAPEMPTYEECIDEALKSLEEDITDVSDEKVEVELYYNGDDCVGFNIDDDEEGYMKAVLIDNSDVFAVDFVFNDSKTDIIKFIGSAEDKDGSVNGSYTLEFKEDEDESAKVVLSLTDVKAEGDNFSGTVRADVSYKDEYEDFTGWVALNSASKKDNIDLSYEIGYNGESFITVSVDCKKTEASDITIPSSDNVYDALDETQLNAYLESCDTEGFMNNIKSALGDELYNALLESGSASSEQNNYDYDYDYDYEYNDYDWDSYDWDDEDWNSGGSLIYYEE